MRSVAACATLQTPAVASGENPCWSRQNSLLAREKFPARSRREFGAARSIIPRKSAAKSSPAAPFSQNSLL